MNFDDSNIELRVFGKCYVCFEKTTNESSCNCKIKICPDCLEQIILNNGQSCTVCKGKIFIKNINGNNQNISNGFYRNYDPDYICAQIIQNLMCVGSTLLCCIICL